MAAFHREGEEIFEHLPEKEINKILKVFPSANSQDWAGEKVTPGGAGNPPAADVQDLKMPFPAYPYTNTPEKPKPPQTFPFSL